MKHIKLFEEFVNEGSTKIPARIKNEEDISNYFWAYEAGLAKEIWGSNSTIKLQAKNEKYYWITYVFKDFYNKYLQLKLVK